MVIKAFRLVREKFIHLEENKKRKRYTGGNVTIIARNCVAGVIYHDLGMEFQSPTINLWIENEDFAVFLENLENFIRGGGLIEKETDFDYPVGELSCNTSHGEKHITLYFQHYPNFEDAKKQWFKRCQRVDFDRVYVIVEDGNNLTQHDIDRFENLRIQRMAILCGEKSIVGKHVIYMKGFTKRNFPGTSVKYRGLFGKRWIDEFDYINFLERI